MFKIANALESRAFLECQHAVFERIAARRVFPLTATPLASLAGRLIETVHAADGQRHFCRALPFLEGRLIGDVEAPGAPLLEDLGRGLASLDRALDGFHHPALERPLLWRPEHGAELVARDLALLQRPERRALVERNLERFRRHTAPRLAGLRRAAIHNDANRANILVDEAGERLLGIIDFGDMVESWLIAEPAIAGTYAMLDRDRPLQAAAAVLRGYHEVTELGADEIAAVPGLVRLRACMSLCIGARQTALEPGNDYLDVDTRAVSGLLETLAGIDDAEAVAAISPL